MKNLLLWAVVLGQTVVHGQTNVYHPFPDSNTTWNYRFLWGCMGGGTTDQNYSIQISGDTLISSQTYHKLTTPYIQTVSTGSCGTSLQAGYKGAIRQDIANKKVFIVPPASNLEELLYNFNLKVGDTLKGYIEKYAGRTLVQSMDSILAGSTYRKRWKTTSNYYVHIIEGIGNTDGLVAFSRSGGSDGPFYSLLCFMQNGQTLYPDTTSYCQPLLTNTNSIDKSSKVNVFPNPFSTVCTIEIDGELKPDCLTIYTSIGKKVKQRRGILGSEIEFKREDLPAGIYFIQLTGNDRIIASEKLVITD